MGRQGCHFWCLIFTILMAKQSQTSTTISFLRSDIPDAATQQHRAKATKGYQGWGATQASPSPEDAAVSPCHTSGSRVLAPSLSDSSAVFSSCSCQNPTACPSCHNRHSTHLLFLFLFNRRSTVVTSTCPPDVSPLCLYSLAPCPHSYLLHHCSIFIP